MKKLIFYFTFLLLTIFASISVAAQHDFNLQDNKGGETWADINRALDALSTLNSGDVDPASAQVLPEVFNGQGLEDATSGGTFSSNSKTIVYIEIDSTGATDTFQWRSNSGVWTTGQQITAGSAQTLADGITVTFAQGTGHTLGDKWFIIGLPANSTQPFQYWADTTSGKLKQRNADNTDWLVLRGLEEASNGVEITYAQQTDYINGGNAPAVELQGTELAIGQDNPTVILQGQERNTLFKEDIPGTTPPMQKVIVDLPNTLPAGLHKLKLSNAKGNAEVFLPFTKLSPHSGASWSSSTTEAPAVYAHSSVVFQDKIWIFGGWNGTYYTDEIYNSHDGVEWHQVVTQGSIWSKRGFGAVVVFVDPTDGVEKLWVLGGYRTSGWRYLNDVWNSSDGIHWNEVVPNQQIPPSNMWFGRHAHAAVVHNGKMWVMGGQRWDGSVTINMNDLWSSVDGVNWVEEDAAAPWTGRYGLAAVSYNNKMWVTGGYGSGRNNEVWTYDESNQTQPWNQVIENAAWADRYFHGFVVYDSKMWVLSGFTNYYPDVWQSTNGYDWAPSTQAAPWAGRGNHSTVVFKQKIWVMGGRDNVSNLLSDVWHTVD